jgi:hypothetical protein
VSRWSLNGIFHNFCISQFPSWFGWASWRRATTNHPYHIWSFGKDFQKNAVAKVKWMLNQFKCKVLELKRTKERIVASKREKKRASDSEAFKQLHRICFWLIVVGSFVTTKSGTGIVGSGFKRWNLYIYICGKVYFTASTQYQQADLYIYIYSSTFSLKWCKVSIQITFPGYRLWTVTWQWSLQPTSTRYFQHKIAPNWAKLSEFWAWMEAFGRLVGFKCVSCGLQTTILRIVWTYCMPFWVLQSESAYVCLNSDVKKPSHGQELTQTRTLLNIPLGPTWPLEAGPKRCNILQKWHRR